MDPKSKITVKEHPEFEEESKRLENTISAIMQEVVSKRSTGVQGGDRWATENLKRYTVNRISKYQDSVYNPYFGRVDFSVDGIEPKKIYYGYSALDLGDYEVVDWRAPVGKLFYGSNAEQQSYIAPEGLIRGKLLLKRHISIDFGDLVDIADEVDRRPDKLSKAKMVSKESFLLQELYSRGDPRLQDIVKTIQEQQDRIIRAPSQQTLVINGVAGSGKTSIAYHRLAYLLYPDTTQGYLKAHNTIVFAPNRLFLSYVSNLLPQLGVKDVNQVAFDDWARGFIRDETIAILERET